MENSATDIIFLPDLVFEATKAIIEGNAKTIMYYGVYRNMAFYRKEYAETYIYLTNHLDRLVGTASAYFAIYKSLMQSHHEKEANIYRGLLLKKLRSEHKSDLPPFGPEDESIFDELSLREIIRLIVEYDEANRHIIRKYIMSETSLRTMLFRWSGRSEEDDVLTLALVAYCCRETHYDEGGGLEMDPSLVRIMHHYYKEDNSGIIIDVLISLYGVQV
jgi:hypothetical protein